MKQAILELLQAAGGLWLVPWAPVVAMILTAWATAWAFPSLVLAAFSIGWPVTWYKWVLMGDDVEGDNT